MDFNECVSKDELKKLVDDQRTYIDGKFNEMMRVAEPPKTTGPGCTDLCC